jgi:hypothetical protein
LLAAVVAARGWRSDWIGRISFVGKIESGERRWDGDEFVVVEVFRQAMW